MGNFRLCDKPVAVADPSIVFTSKYNIVSIVTPSRGMEIATVNVATPSLSSTVTFVSTKPTTIPTERGILYRNSTYHSPSHALTSAISRVYYTPHYVTFHLTVLHVVQLQHTSYIHRNWQIVEGYNLSITVDILHLNITFTSNILQLNITSTSWQQLEKLMHSNHYCHSDENSWVEWKEQFALSMSGFAVSMLQSLALLNACSQTLQSGVTMI